MDYTNELLTEAISGIEYPSLLTRIKATTIDVFIFICYCLLTGVLLKISGDVPAWVRGVLFFSPVVFYEPCMVATKGGTIGHQLMKIRVKRVHDEHQNLNLFMAFYRFVLKAILGWISFLTISFNARSRAIHDIAGGAIMVYKN